jgi:predicted SAM-dependent methyltransferase
MIHNSDKTVPKPRGITKLHLGCGNIHKNGYINVDVRKTDFVDVVCDLNVYLGRQSANSSSVIESYHVIEHLGRHVVPKMLSHCYRVLVPNGKLILECPDFDQAVKDYVAGNKTRIDNIFGLQRTNYDYHKFGYTKESLEEVLRNAGFKNIMFEAPTDSHKDYEPCMRVVCIK